MRRRHARRAPAATTRWRLLGGLLMLLAAGGFASLAGSDAFAVDEDDVTLSGVRYTDAQVLRSLLAPWLDERPNVFRLPTAELEEALLELPAVAAADVTALLPDRVAVRVTERVPVFVLRAGESDFLVDPAGVLLSLAPADDGAVAELPVVEDGRHDETPPSVGDVLEPVDLAAMLKLAAVDPELVGSSAESLALRIEDADGYVLLARPDGWRAVFGHYTPTLRPPETIDRQVQCLRALLGAGEEQLEVVYLSPADERCGTFLPRRTPEPAGSPSESGTPAASTPGP